METINKEEKKPQSSIKVHMSPELRETFARVTRQLGQSQSAVVRQLIAAYIDRYEDIQLDITLTERN